MFLLKNSGPAINEPPVKTKPEIDIDTLLSVDTDILEDSHVYVHCYFRNEYEDALIRIWKSTYLVDLSSGSRSKLVHIENISYAPQWTLIPNGATYSFLLIFSSLPKSCVQFDLIEMIPQPGGFHVKNIQRNQTDVYHVDL